MRISFIVVNYNTSNYVLTLLDSIAKYVVNDQDYEVIVVDNHSERDSLALLMTMKSERISIIESDENLGFAKANNLASEVATGDILFFLNPDTRLLSPIDIGMIPTEELSSCYFTTRVVDENHEIYKNVFCFPFVKNHLKRLIGRACDVWVQGSVLLMSRDVFKDTGGWPEDYFMYGEDLDFSYCLFRKGYSLEQLDYTVMHVRGASTDNVWSKEQRYVRTKASFKKFMLKYGYRVDYWLYSLFKYFRRR